MSPRLVELSPALAEPFLRLADEVRHAEEEFASVAAVHRDTLPAYLARLEGLRSGAVQGQALVPMSSYWLLGDDGELLGMSRLRHRLTPLLREHGGHIGFAIRPSARRRGHGVALLALTLERGREAGLGRAMLTCDVDNAGSRRVIERCGGVLDGEYVSPRTAVPIRRYWIELGGASEEVLHAG